ncbi:MAG: [Fe-S]-binding protein [Bacteroidetes bacterium]|nr:[Fe-S]-binding protein [Bacteroidota bacterium]
MKLYEIFSKTPFFLSASTWIKKSDNPVESSHQARSAVIIPLLLMQYGSMRDKLKSLKIIGKYFRNSITQMRKSAKGLSLNPNLGKKTIDSETLRKLESFIYSLGISQLGYTKVKPDFIFNGFKVLYDNAIVISMEMKREDMRHNPSDEATKEIWRTYSSLGVAVNKIASFLRERGYNCHASPAVGGDVMIVPIAQQAGLGAVGKNGLLITPEFGPSQRLAAIFVDIENLPQTRIEDNEHLWVRDFCETCNHCIKKCPGQAIYEETKTLEDGYPQFIDREKCAPAFSKNCSICISSCPFFNGKYDHIKKIFDRRNRMDEPVLMAI